MVEKGRNEEAFKIMSKFRKDNDEEFMRKEFKQLLEQTNWDKENEVTSIIGILKKPSYRRRLIIGCGIQIGQQICGISAINYYQTIMYKTLGISGNTVLALAGVWGLTGPLANLFCLVRAILCRAMRRT